MRRSFFALLFSAAFSVIFFSSAAAQSVVRIVMFQSPGCHYCTEVKQQQLPGWFKEGLTNVNQYFLLNPDENAVNTQPYQLFRGKEVELLMVNIDTPKGDSLWEAVGKARKLGRSRMKVPMIVVENAVIVGSDPIRRQLSGLIKKGLNSPGVDWPAEPGIRVALQDIAAKNYDARFALLAPQPGLFDYFKRSPVAAAIGTALLAWLLFVFGAGVFSVVKNGFRERPPRTVPWIPVLLATLGFCISAYLTIMHFTRGDLACGPLSDCDLVTGSRYALLFGFFPVSLIGLLGYLFLAGALWFSVQTKNDDLWRSMQIASGVAVLFSVYLISTSIFLIQGLCPWCMASALTSSEIFRRVR